MLPRFIATQAWVERHGLSDADLGWFGNADVNLADAVPAGEGDACPRCGQHPDDCQFQIPVPDSVTSTPETVRGRAYVECLCRTLYYYTFSHTVDAHQPLGQAHVRAAAAAPPVVPPKPVVPPLSLWAPDYENGATTMRRSRQGWHPAYYDTPPSPAPWIYAAVQAKRRNPWEDVQPWE